MGLWPSGTPKRPLAPPFKGNTPIPNLTQKHCTSTHQISPHPSPTPLLFFGADWDRSWHWITANLFLWIHFADDAQRRHYGATGAQGSRLKKTRGAFSSFSCCSHLSFTKPNDKTGIETSETLDAELKRAESSQPLVTGQIKGRGGMNGDEYQVQGVGFLFTHFLHGEVK